MVVATLGKIFPALSVESSDRNFIRDMWDKLHKIPGGKTTFSKIIGKAAPYSGTIDSKVLELGNGKAVVELRDRPAVRNHLRCVHAIALVNLAEIAGNLALSYSMPDDARFIVAGLSIEYLKKARGTIRGLCDMEPITSSERQEYQVPVRLVNEANEVVATATLRTLVGPKKK